VSKHGVIAGHALVDPKADTVPVRIMNLGDTVVVLPAYTRIGLLTPVDQDGVYVENDKPTDQRTDPDGLTASAQADLSPTGLSAEVRKPGHSSGHPVPTVMVDGESCEVSRRTKLLGDKASDQPCVPDHLQAL
jgi:hypothetical protein